MLIDTIVGNDGVSTVIEFTDIYQCGAKQITMQPSATGDNRQLASDITNNLTASYFTMTAVTADVLNFDFEINDDENYTFTS